MLLPLRVETRLLCRKTTTEEIAILTLDGTDTQNELIKSFDNEHHNEHLFPSNIWRNTITPRKGTICTTHTERLFGHRRTLSESTKRVLNFKKRLPDL